MTLESASIAGHPAELVLQSAHLLARFPWAELDVVPPQRFLEHTLHDVGRGRRVLHVGKALSAALVPSIRLHGAASTRRAVHSHSEAPGPCHPRTDRTVNVRGAVAWRQRWVCGSHTRTCDDRMLSSVFEWPEWRQLESRRVRWCGSTGKVAKRVVRPPLHARHDRVAFTTNNRRKEQKVLR